MTISSHNKCYTCALGGLQNPGLCFRWESSPYQQIRRKLEEERHRARFCLEQPPVYMHSGAYSNSQRLEIAHVLFMDIVSYSLLPIDDQSKVIQQLQYIVRSSPEFRQAIEEDQAICLPTGDGMAIVFFGDPIAPVACARHISVALKKNVPFQLRMGIQSCLPSRRYQCKPQRRWRRNKPRTKGHGLRRWRPHIGFKARC